MEALEARLRSRGSEDNDSVRTRLDNAAAELAAAEDADLVTHTIVNDDVETAYRELCAHLSKHTGWEVQPAGQQSAAVAEPTVGLGTAGAAGGGADEAGPSRSAAAQAGADFSGRPGASDAFAPESGAGSAPSANISATDYLQGTVVEPLKEALLALNTERPQDPLQFLIDKLMAMKGGSEQAQPSLL